MEYFEILNLKREPFSNSPDPDFFFQSRQHVDCLQKLEIALRLRRGLNVVIGDVGTGKTTLCRQLIRKFSDNKDVETYLILDPHFSNPSGFLRHIATMLEEEGDVDGMDDGAVKERIKHQLFKKGVDEEKTAILIIDEGQKIPQPCLEILRELLNYETNEYKLLQIVIFAQKEFDTTIEEYANFSDRINLYHILEPLGFKDTLRMIRFRLSQSGEGEHPLYIFTLPALLAVYLATGGYPRKIVNLCHRCMLTIIVQNRSTAGWFLVRSCVKRVFRNRSGKTKFYRTVAAMAVAVLVFIILPEYGSITNRFFEKTEQKEPHQHAQVLIKPESIVKTKERETRTPVSETDSGKKRTGRKKNTLSKQKAEPSPGSFKTDDAVQPGNSPEAIKHMNAAGPAGEVQNVRIPVVLGRVTLKKGESLWLMSKQIYGSFNNRILKRLISTNPQVTNPDNVGAGTRINFPAIRVDVNPPDAGCWWVYLDEKDSLDAAFGTLRAYPKDAPPVRLVPNLSPGGSLRFTIVTRDYFFDREKAEQMLGRIPEEFSRLAKIFPGWEEKETVYFADPFLS